MTCDDARPLIAALGDGTLDDASRLRLDDHLGTCPACRDRIDRRSRLDTLLRAALTVPDPGEAHFERQRQRALAAVGSRPRRLPTTLRLVAAAALAAAAVFMIVKGPVLVSKPAPSIPPAPAPIAARPEAPVNHPELPVVRPEPPTPPTLEKPAVAIVPAPAVPAGPAPGSAGRAVRMSRESVEVALAETPSERVAALCTAAEAQLHELAEAVVKDPALAAELAGAYRLLVGEGVAGVLRDRAESEKDLSAARDIAAHRARDHEATLAALSDGTTGPLKDRLALALEASRSLSGR